MCCVEFLVIYTKFVSVIVVRSFCVSLPQKRKLNFNVRSFMQIKVSIIIPVYNGEKFIARCLDALVGQSLRDIEIICVDDGSADTTFSILESYEQKDIRIKALTQSNKGPGGARNAGLKRAEGEYISFIDADDRVGDDYLEKLYNVAKLYDADLVTVGMKKVYPSYTKFRAKVSVEGVYEDVQEKYRVSCCPPEFYVMNKLYKAESLRAIDLRFDEGVCYEDVMFVARAVCELKKLVSLPDVYYEYINHSNGVTKGTQTPKKQLEKYQAHKQFVAYCKANNIELDAKYKNLTKRYYSLFGVAILKIKENQRFRVWKLFDFIPVWMVRL